MNSATQPPMDTSTHAPDTVHSLHQLFEQQAVRTPELEALRFEGQPISYAELDRRANQLAHYLRELGVGPDEIVALFMERSLDLVVALLAVLKAGGAYLPIDTSYPEPRVQFLLDDAQVPVVLTQQCHADRLSGFNGTVLPLDAQAGFLANYPAHAPAHVTQQNDLAYVIYTSGSTGQPKGCLLSHAAICNRLQWMQDTYRLRPGDRVLQKTPYTFDVSVWEFFWPLLAGATLVLATPQGHKDPHYLAQAIRAERITVCHFVPSMLRLFLNGVDATACTTLRHVFTSGEALPFDLMRRFKQALGARLHNLYGPTEAAVDVSSWECEIRLDHMVPIGRAIRNIRLYILDAARRPVPRGTEGELHIAGVGLARGYLRRPELTAERFVDDPFHSGERMYRTGDRAVELDDGNIDFLGRVDFQVKLRGLRIELGEIETRLRRLDGVSEAAVLVRGEDDGDPKLVAYLEAAHGSALDPGEVRRFVAAELPEYMVPSLVVTLSQLPVNVHGKLDRSALPWPVSVWASASVSGEGLPAPAMPAEVSALAAPDAAPYAGVLARLGEIVSALLKAGAIAPQSNLFDLGATSLTMVRIVEQIRAEFGVSVPLNVFLDEPTLAGLAHHVVQKGRTVADASRAQAAPTSLPLQDIALPAVAYRADARVAEGEGTRWSPHAVPFDAFSGWVGLLMAGLGQGDAKYRYPSGGGLNAVRTYVVVREGRVDGVPGGRYYYQPETHALHPVGSGAEVHAAAFGADAARFEEAGFALVFIAEMNAVEPLYKQVSAALVALEAGYMSQLLLAAQDAHGLACAPAAGVDADRLAGLLDLSTTECFAHALLAGVPAAGQAPAAANTAGLSAFAARACVRHDAAESLFAGEAGPSLTSDQLHAERRHLRRFADGSPALPLSTVRFDWAEHALRATSRSSAAQPVPLASVGRLLGMLRHQGDGGARQYLHGAVAPRRALEVYVYLREVHGAPAGLYRYDAPTHRLLAVAPSLVAEQVEQVYTPYNRQHFKHGSFCLFVFGRHDPALPQQVALHAALLDAGCVGQLLMDRQAEFGLGLCPIGAIRFEKIQDVFGLRGDLSLLHTFIGGSSTRPVPDSRRRIEATCAPATPSSSPSSQAGRQAADEGVAIVGISGRLPGAENLQEFWRNLRSGVDSIGPLPPGRAAATRMDDMPAGGYLPDIASFDSLLFGIAPVEARGLDPQERVLLEEVWAALEDAGCTAAELVTTCPRVGVFVGAMWNDYQSVGLDHWHASGRAGEFSHHASLANRISFAFDFDGPSLAVNTSCASSLSALHLAAESIRRGECDAAIVGGVNLFAHPYHARLLSDLGMLSSDGRARPLSAEANGWVPGEGAVAVVLKALHHAERDGHTIRGLVRASAIGHSGRSARYGAPHMQRQAEHLRRLLSTAGLAPADVDYIEAAAPGASLADAAEMHAVQAVFGQPGRAEPCRVGTVKGNIGHLESASGLSQLAKVLLQLQHGSLAPSLHSEPRNPLIVFDEGTLSVVTQAMPWCTRGQGAARQPRHALINAIGAAGSSGHVLIAEYLAPPRVQPVANGPQVVVLSAATVGQLGAQLGRLLGFIDEAHDLSLGLSLADLAHTLRIGRVPMRERLALVSDDLPALRAQLHVVAAADLGADAGAAGVHRGTVDAGRAGTARVGGADAQQLAAAWVRGDPVDWSALDRPGQRRIALPTCVFERARHWLEADHGAVPMQATKPVSIADAESALLADLEPRTHALLVRELAQASGVPASRIGLDQPLETLGLNSLIVQVLMARLGQGLPGLARTVFFEHRTLRSLATSLIREHRAALMAMLGLGDVPGAVMSPVGLPSARSFPRHLTTAAAQPPAFAAPPPDEIAIVGLAGRYPQAETLKDFWRNLAAGRDCIEEVPADRWDHHRYADGTRPAGPSRWGGFLRDADAFDPLFFGIAPLEAERMDPQERLFLETAWHVMEDAGYNRESLAAHCQNHVGVFVGVMYGEYQLYPSLPQGLSVSGTYGSIANRVSYVLNLRGPSMAIDTMCSSSLTALHLACESIHRGDCAWAIAGGVNLSLHPSKYATHAMLNMPSSDGRCRSFGAGGDGFVAGEGVGAVLLKPLRQALSDGDHVYGVIKGSAINHGGKTNGYTVPNPDAQQEVIATALRRARIDPRSISYVEAHGTGTSLGDPIEIAGLSRAFAEHVAEQTADRTPERQFCAIGSVKSNIGHAESAAGIAGLTKVLLQMQHGQLVPSLHAQSLNPDIDFARTPFVLQREAAPWLRPDVNTGNPGQPCPRRAGISSFGAGGSNAHVIVEEAHGAGDETLRLSSKTADGRPALVVLSARTAPRLQAQVAQLLEAVEQGLVCDDNLIDVAYTLQVGREPMEERLALAVHSTAEMAEKLGALAEGNAEPEGVHRDQTRRHRGEFSMLSADLDMADTVDAWIRKGKHAQVLALWVKGLAFDWNLLYREHRPRRVSLPTYPFARDRYWVSPPGGGAAGMAKPPRRSGFDRVFFENLFKAVDGDLLSIAGALAQARNKF